MLPSLLLLLLLRLLPVTAACKLHGQNMPCCCCCQPGMHAGLGSS